MLDEVAGGDVTLHHLPGHKVVVWEGRGAAGSVHSQAIAQGAPLSQSPSCSGQRAGCAHSSWSSLAPTGLGAPKTQQAGTGPRWEPRWPSQSPWDDQREPRHLPQPQQMPAKVSGQLTFPVLLSRPRVPRGVCKQAPVSPVLTFECLVPTADSCGWPPPRATPLGSCSHGIH